MDYEELKRKKLEELKSQYTAQQEEQQKEVEAEMQLKSMLSRLLTPEAKSRLSNVSIVNRELYLAAAKAIIYLSQRGNLRGTLDDKTLKKLLEKLSAKRETKITRK